MMRIFKRFTINTIVKFIMLFTTLFLISSCSKTNLDDVRKEIEDSLPKMLFMGDKINIPHEIDGKPIKFKVNTDGYLDADGKVIKVDFSDVELEMEIFFDGKFLIKKTITLSKNLDAYFDEVERYIRSYVRTRTINNLNLINHYYYSDEVQIEYFSDRPEIIDNNGIHYPHEYDEVVNINVTVTTRGKIHNFVIQVEAVGLPDSEKLIRVQAWVDEYLENTILLDDSPLPTTHPQYGGEIKWIASDPLVVISNQFFLPKTSKTVVFMTEITFPFGDLRKDYVVELEASQMTDLERAKRFIDLGIEKDFKDLLVLYDGSSPQITQNLIEGDVKNKVYGTNREDLDPSDLDRWFYEGYEKPNDDNILFIVVHETGIRTPGRDALFFSDFQYNKAYVFDEVDAWTSWHYTVDDHSIYQSFQDETECWHAGNGDIYGIGIEMCINSDGYYDASLCNNARLIASLLIKHNLGMQSLKMHNDYSSKPCPETMLKDRRWFEFLEMISKEYVSQSLLSKFDITYNVPEIEGVRSWDIDQVLYNEGIKEDAPLIIETTINGEKIIINVKANAK
jgi:hypothetical protein